MASYVEQVCASRQHSICCSQSCLHCSAYAFHHTLFVRLQGRIVAASERYPLVQFDIHSPGATVYEALIFSAELRLMGVSRSQMRTFVAEV